MVIISLAAYYLTSLLFLSFVGFWAARLLRPSAGRYTALLAPLLGYCLVAIASSFLNSILLNMTHATYVILLAAGLLNLWAVSRTGWPKIRLRRSEQGAVSLAALGAYAVNVLPLAHAGSTAFIGRQWDLELYLPIVEYLKRFAIGTALAAPDNPLVAGMNSAPFRGGSGWGFSYFQAAVDVLLGWMSYESFRPALGFLAALSVLSLYVFARSVLRVSHRTALTAAVLWAMNGLASWVASSGLAGHAISFATIPLALTLTTLALTAPAPRTVLLAAISAAGMLLSYYTGALLLYGAGMAAIGLEMALRRPRPLAPPLLAALGVASLVGVFGAVGHLRFLEVAPLYATQGFTVGWHDSRFIPLGEALGLIPDGFVAAQTASASLFGPAWAPLLDGLAFLVTQLALAVCLFAAFTRGWRRARFLSLWLGFGLIAAYFRFVADYPYGYFKVLSLTGFLFPIALSQGFWALWSDAVPVVGALKPRWQALMLWTARALMGRGLRSVASLRRVAVAGAALGFVALLCLNLFLSVRFFWTQSDDLRPGVWELAALRRYVPPGAAVRITGNGSFTPQENAMLAYFLLDNPIVGAVRTAYGNLVSGPGNTAPRYVAAPAGPAGVSAATAGGRLLWSNAVVALYEIEQPAPAIGAALPAAGPAVRPPANEQAAAGATPAATRRDHVEAP